jgi:hypothetical protein
MLADARVWERERGAMSDVINGSSAVVQGALQDIRRLLEVCETDNRTKIARELRSIREALAADHGGESKCSNAQLAMLDVCAREWLYLNLLDSYIMNQGLLLNRRKKRVHGIVHDRNRLSEVLASHMKILGVRRKP